MKYKNYLLCLLIMVFAGCHFAYADEGSYNCYYISSSNDFKASVRFDYNANGEYSGHKVYVDFNGKKNDHNEENIINLNSSKSVHGVKLDAIGKDIVKSKSCPKYLVFEYDEFLIHNYHIWATMNASDAKLATDAINSKNKKSGSYASFTNSSSGKPITGEEYYGTFTNNGIKGDDISNIDCKSLFDSKTGEYSLRELVNEVLQYPRIIVPILIIVLGTLDLARAVIAAKEDDMKKAQAKFVKRVILGVAFFFIPLFVNIIMDLADIVWEGLGLQTCEF